MIKLFNPASVALVVILLISLHFVEAQQPGSVKQPVAKTINGLRYINTYVLPNQLKFRKTTVGGLSGIDFDPVTQTYYMISDDRSAINPARFYKAKIDISATGIDRVSIIGVDTLLQQDGNIYPKLAAHATNTTDPEAMRYNGATQQLVWTSEGERIITKTDTVLIDPTINVVSASGKYAGSIPLPENLKMRLTESGPRRNGVLEGLTFADNFNTLYVNLEEPLYQDGPRAGLERNRPFIRIYKFDLKNKKNTAQYAYELEPVPQPPTKKGDEINNGIPDILWLGPDRFLVTERSYSGGPLSHVKVFLAESKAADNIIGVKSLIETPVKHAVKKKLLLNMDDLGMFIDNIEGATFGPVLPNGHQSIIFVADNNFSAAEQSQLMLFEIIP
jgi:hypothetical protein